MTETPQTTNAQTSEQTAPARPRFTTRSLLLCVVLGAFTAAILHLARIVGMMLLATAPWLGSPSALIPWFVMILVAALLVPRAGAALLTSVIGTLAGVGTMSLMAGIVIELVFISARAIQRRRGGIAEVGDRSGLWVSIVAAVLVGAMSFGMLFAIKEFQALTPALMSLGIVVRIVAGLAYGALAYGIVRGLLGAGFDPIGPGRRKAGR